MAKGLSIHIGLNRVDPSGYNGWDGQLSACVNDAQAMQSIAKSLGYSPILLLNEQATSSQVLKFLGKAAQQLVTGDILLLTYSGHGGQIPDVNGDEDDKLDETWVLYDRELIDDELYAMWSQFNAGVRIFMLSDSCHSGTITKVRAYEQLSAAAPVVKKYRGESNKPPAFRLIPWNIQIETYQQHADMYDTLQWKAVKGNRASIGASVILISGCMDNQLSADGDQNGLFTGTLLKVWKNGAFVGNYAKFRQDIVKLMPGTQTPNYLKVGSVNANFENQKPFTISDQAAGTGGTQAPTYGTTETTEETGWPTGTTETTEETGWEGW
jgi:metacaspase-1